MKHLFPAMMPSALCHFRLRQATVLTLLVALFTLGAAPLAHAADLLWDADNVTADAQDGSGTWTNNTGNWRNLTSSTDNQNWVNANLDSAIFGAGTDGTYAITLAGTVQAGGGITFSNSGYTLSGTTLRLTNATTVNSPITVVAGKTATINSQITYRNNSTANITNETGATLNLGGGAGNSQYNFYGGGTVNMTAGTYNANVGRVNVATFNQTGGTFNITPGNNVGYWIGNAADQSVNYTLTNATLSVNGNASTTSVKNAFLGLGNAAGSTDYANTLTVQNGATVNIGTTASRAGELRIAGNTSANGTLDVQGGTVTIGTGDTLNQIYFFKGGSGSGYTATMTQSGGTVTANGIQFGEIIGSFDPASSATLQLNGGSLYVGAQGITVGFAASGVLPVTIQLQGGTLGADQNWSSSLDMKLGTTGGGPIIRAQNSASTARNITLSGILSDDGAVNGTLTKTGAGTLTLSGASANTFTGPTLVSAGTLDLGKASAVSSSSSVTIADGAALALSTSSSTVPNLTFTNTGALSFDVAGGYSLTVSAANGVTNSGAASSVTINITGSAPANGTYTLIAYSGALQGSGFSAYTLGSTPAGKSYKLNDTGGAVQLIVLDSYFWTGAQSTEWSTNTIAGSKNWTQGQFGSQVDYTNGQDVVFDDTATGYTVDISVADVTPASVTFTNSGATPYTLQGSKAIAGSTALSMSGSQTLTILNANTYTGGSTLGQGSANIGTVGIGHNSALGAGKITALGAQLQAIGGERTLTNDIDVGSGALRFGGTNNLTLSGAITLIGGNREIGMYTTDRTLTLSGGVNLNGNALTLNGDANIVNSTMLFSAPITGSGNLALHAAFTNGVATLTAPNTYNGTTTISGGTLRLGASEVIPDGTNSGNVTLTGTLDLNGFSETINGLSGAGIVDTIAGGTPTLTVGNGNATSTFGGVIQNSIGTLALVKTGTGTLTLTNANTFAGGVTIKNGTLESRTTQTTLGTGTVVMGGAGSSGATYITGQANTNAFTINAPDSGTNIIGANGAGSGFTLTGPVTLNGDLTVQSFFSGSLQSASARPILNGGITGTGNLILNNLSGGTNTITLGVNPINHTGSITAQGGSLGSNVISAVIGANVTGVIQNSATSPLILSATNTYTGPTTVNAGTLVIQVASLAAGSTVSVAEGAVLQLDFTTTNVVAGFITNGVSLPAGVYNAANVTPFIAGAGSLQVAAAGPSGPATLTNSFNGTTLSLSWPAEGWKLQQQTNALSKGLFTNWVDVTDGSVSSTNITVDKTRPTVFYRLVYP